MAALLGLLGSIIHSGVTPGPGEGRRDWTLACLTSSPSSAGFQVSRGEPRRGVAPPGGSAVALVCSSSLSFSGILLSYSCAADAICRMIATRQEFVLVSSLTNLLSNLFYGAQLSVLLA